MPEFEKVFAVTSAHAWCRSETQVDDRGNRAPL